MMTRHVNGKVYDNRYNEKHPIFSIRISPAILEQIPGEKTKYIKNAIEEKLAAINSPDSSTRTALLHFLIQTFIDAELEIDIPDALYAELTNIMEQEMKIHG